MEERQDYKVFWIVAFSLLLLTRIPAMANYLSIDNVNLAFSLEKFDPRIHQPQPPGYPFFVLLGKIANVFFRDAERTFVVLSLLVGGLCLPAAYLLGQRMFSRWAGAAAALLLLLNPVFWQSTLDGPLRPHLALFSLLTAYCCWRCWNGEKSFAVWGAVALGVGSGFRPDLVAFLFPLWIISAWVGTKSWRAVLKGLVVLSAIGLIWVGALVIAMGGLRAFTKIMLDYAVDQSRQESVVLGSSAVAWLRQINRLVIWNGLAIVTWIWAIPFYFRNPDRRPPASIQGIFVLVWLVPGLIVQALIHVAAPGHTLFSVVALCIVGGYVLSFARARDLALGVALVVNVMLFLDFFNLPSGLTASARQTPSIKNAILFGMFETSIGQVRFMDEVARVTLKEIEEFTPKDRPSMIITTDTSVDQWFLNWRICRYYLPGRDIWTLYSVQNGHGLQRVRRDVVLDKLENTSLKVPIFTNGRILWLIEPQSAFQRSLASKYPLAGGRFVFYTDVADGMSVSVDGVEFVPQPFGFLSTKATAAPGQ